MDSLKQGVQQVVNEIYNEFGYVKPSILVERAKDKRSTAHDGFEWDDKQAGIAHRLWQARQWIKRVEIIIEEKPHELIHVPIITVGSRFESEEGYYKPKSVLVKDEFDAAMDETLTRFNSAKQAYMSLKEIASTIKPKKKPDFKKADRGIRTFEKALARSA